LVALQKNSLKSQSERLELVPNQEGGLPEVADYPESISHLVAAGNVRLPTTNAPNTWDKRKCANLLAFYNADDAYDCETDDENSDAARDNRVKLCKVLGITAYQIQQVSISILNRALER